MDTVIRITAILLIIDIVPITTIHSTMVIIHVLTIILRITLGIIMDTIMGIITVATTLRNKLARYIMALVVPVHRIITTGQQETEL